MKPLSSKPALDVRITLKGVRTPLEFPNAEILEYDGLVLTFFDHDKKTLHTTSYPFIVSAK